MCGHNLQLEEPANIELRLNLLDLALQNATRMTSREYQAEG